MSFKLNRQHWILGWISIFLFSCTSLKKYPVSSHVSYNEEEDFVIIYPHWFQKDVPYRFEMDAQLWIKKLHLKGQMMWSNYEEGYVVQFYSDFGKNLLLLRKSVQDGEWQVEYVLPEMNYPGLLEWIIEDIEVFLVTHRDNVAPSYGSAENFEWYKHLKTARSIVYLQPNLISPPDRAYLLNGKGKIIKTYLSNGQEVRVEYKKPSISFKFSELYATE